MRIGAVILAAGSSARMGGADKQLTVLRGKPVILRSAEALCASEYVGEIVIVANKDNIKAISGLFQKPLRIPVKVVEGGKNRFASAKNGFFALSGECDYVAVHDGARPLVKPEDIKRAAEAAEKHGAAILCVPVQDTLKRVENGAVVASPKRSEFFRAQTPQIFSRAVYAEAVWNAEEKGFADDVTDDSQLVERLGAAVMAVEGSNSNIKLTTPTDFAVAESILDNERGDSK